MKYFNSNQIAIYLALNIQERKYKYEVQSICNEDLYFSVYEPSEYAAHFRSILADLGHRNENIA